MTLATSDRLYEDLRLMGYGLPDHLLSATITLRQGKFAELTATTFVNQRVGVETETKVSELTKREGPPLTMHVDGSFTHCEWHVPRPTRGKFALWLTSQPEPAPTPAAETAADTPRWAEGSCALAEKLRHEPRNFVPDPIPGVIDYAMAAGWVARALHHLDEALPSGQRARTLVALELMEQGVKHLRKWVDAKTKDEP